MTAKIMIGFNSLVKILKSWLLLESHPALNGPQTFRDLKLCIFENPKGRRRINFFCRLLRRAVQIEKLHKIDNKLLKTFTKQGAIKKMNSHKEKNHEHEHPQNSAPTACTFAANQKYRICVIGGGIAGVSLRCNVRKASMWLLISTSETGCDCRNAISAPRNPYYRDREGHHEPMHIDRKSVV